MAKKYFVMFTDAKGNIVNSPKYSSPIYGEITYGKVDELVSYGKRIKAAYCEVTRRTDGHFVAFLMINVKTGEVHRQTTPRVFGPGYY